MTQTAPEIPTPQEQAPLGIAVEDAGPARKCLTIEVPAERIARSLKDSFGKLRQDTQLPGFRRGHAPMRLLEKRFGESIREDVRDQLLSDCVAEAVKQRNLEILGDPEIQDLDTLSLPESGSLTFKVEVEVLPEVVLPELDGIRVEKRRWQLTDEDIGRAIEAFRLEAGQTKLIEDRPAEPGDHLQVDLRVRAGSDAGPDATELLHRPQADVVTTLRDDPRKGIVAGILVDGMVDMVAGKRPGDEVTVSITGPASHEDDRIRNQPITMWMQIRKVLRHELADDATLVRMLGVDSMPAATAHVRKWMEARVEREEVNQMRRQVADHLMGQVDLTLPEGVTGRQTLRTLTLLHVELASQGVPQPEIEQRVAELRGASEEVARRQLKRFFILDQAARRLQIEVTEEDINGRVAQLALARGRRPEKVRQELQKSGVLQFVAMQLSEELTLDRIIELAEVVEVEARPAGSGATPPAV